MVVLIVGTIAFLSVMCALATGLFLQKQREKQLEQNSVHYVMWFYGSGDRVVTLNTVPYDHVVAIAEMYKGIAIVMEVQPEDY